MPGAVMTVGGSLGEQRRPAGFGLFPQRPKIDSEQLPARLELPPGHEDGVDVAGMRGEHDRRGRGAAVRGPARWGPAGKHIWRGRVEHDDIGLLADRERTADLVEAVGPGPV